MKKLVKTIKYANAYATNKIYKLHTIQVPTNTFNKKLRKITKCNFIKEPDKIFMRMSKNWCSIRIQSLQFHSACDV